MLSIKVDSVTGVLVRQLLIEPGGRSDEALCFHYHCRMGYYHNNNSYETSRGLHLAYYKKPSSSYVTVFSAIDGNPFAKGPSLSQWKMEVHHDSCWRDIRTFSKVYFDMAAEINKKIVEDGGKEVAPCDMHEFNTAPTFGDLFNFRPVEVIRNSDPENQYGPLSQMIRFKEKA